MKKLVKTRHLYFPVFGSYKQLDVVTLDGKEKFIIDINRKGRIKISKCTFQNRCRKDINLLRLDIDGPPHTNPDGQEITPNHLHIYKEGFGDAWAVSIPTDVFSDISDLGTTLIEFLEYCKIVNTNGISVEGGLFS